MGTPSRIPPSCLILSLLGSGKLESGAILCKISKLERLLIDFDSRLDDGDDGVCPWCVKEEGAADSLGVRSTVDVFGEWRVEDEDEDGMTSGGYGRGPRRTMFSRLCSCACCWRMVCFNVEI
jgi:hypothetical protein